MADRTFLDWPFFTGEHRMLATNLESWATAEIAPHVDHEDDLDEACCEYVSQLGAGGWLRYVVPAAYGGVLDRPDVRSICIARETLARFSGLADFAFAMQGLGTGPITLFGSEEMKERYLPPVAAGEAIPAFAISEADAGSDVNSMTTVARKDSDGRYIIDGAKSWISNAGLADHYTVFCRYPELGESAFIALVVDDDNPGLSVRERVDLMAPHPLGTVVFKGCRVPASAVIGDPGDGLKVAFATLDMFRATVGAAALGFARRAFDEAVEWTGSRQAFGKPLSGFQMTAARLADMATSIDAAALLVYRAAWARDLGTGPITREAAMAKLFATEAAQEVIDSAVQLLGARGVVAGHPVERLYREVRALRIYEGTSEIQKLVIARQVMARGEPHVS
jgi:acyl-CoA dehydrogenase